MDQSHTLISCHKDTFFMSCCIVFLWVTTKLVLCACFVFVHYFFSEFTMASPSAKIKHMVSSFNLRNKIRNSGRPLNPYLSTKTQTGYQFVRFSQQSFESIKIHSEIFVFVAKKWKTGWDRKCFETESYQNKKWEPWNKTTANIEGHSLLKYYIR